jgi:hypothetical protein
MNTYPEILDALNHDIYNLSDEEKIHLLETKQLLEINKYNFALFPLWNAVILNLQRRVEDFGISSLINLLDSSDSYDKYAGSLKERWVNINEFKIVSYAKQLNTISNIPYNLINTLYWMKNNPKQKKIEEEEIYSILYLLDINLFSLDFKMDKRKSDLEDNKLKRRKNDIENANSIPAKTHQQLLFKSNVKKFEDELKQKVIQKQKLDYY